VLVRMKNDRIGGKRTNWLLIKHHDQNAHDGDGDAILGQDRSVASGRTMAAIAAGKGRGPKPFMLSEEAAVDPGAVWDSTAASQQKSGKRVHGPLRRRPRTARLLRTLSLRNFVKAWKDRQPGRGRPTKSFDGYRVQHRVAAGSVKLKTRKGLDWTDKFASIAKSAASLPDSIVDGEIVALDSLGAPDFAALQAATVSHAPNVGSGKGRSRSAPLHRSHGA
jgi:bifunctional non-homologous end joining protein LigD